MIGPYYVDQVPAEDLVLTVTDAVGAPKDLSSYTTVALILRNAAGVVDTTGGTTATGVEIGSVTYSWPTTTLFATAGTYTYQVAMDGPGTVHDLSEVGSFEVLSATSLLPTPQALADFWGESAPFDEADWLDVARRILQQSADLFWLVTGMSTLPTEEHQARLVSYAIMDMAMFIKISGDSAEEAYNPLSGERIGSYSYSGLRQKAQDGSTGVFWWDLVVSAIRGGEWDDAYTLLISGEWVFTPYYNRWVRSERLLHRNPLVIPSGAFDVSLVDPASSDERWVSGGSTSDSDWAYDPYGWYGG